MKRFFSIFVFSALFLSLVSCNNGDQSRDDELGEIVEVDLQVQETAEVGERITAFAHVTQGDNEVDDADEVVFEVWEEGSKIDSKMIDFTEQEKGKYFVELQFDQEGVYVVQVHVTARRMHVMPKTKIVVGNPETTQEGTDS